MDINASTTLDSLLDHVMLTQYEFIDANFPRFEDSFTDWKEWMMNTAYGKALIVKACRQVVEVDDLLQSLWDELKADWAD